MNRILLFLTASLYLLTACGPERDEAPDLGTSKAHVDTLDAGDDDAGSADAGDDDAGSADAGDDDAGSADAGDVDGGPVDAGDVDAGSADAGSGDAGSADAGSADAGSGDAGSADAGNADAGSADAGGGDAGSPDGGDAGSADAGRPDGGDAGSADGGTQDGGTQDGGTDAGPVAMEFPLTLSESSVDFGPQAACTPAEATVALRNPSTKTRKIHQVSITGGFKFLGLYDTSNTLCTLPCTVPPMPLGSTNRMDVRVGFSPLQPSTFHGTLTLFTDDPNAQSLTVTLDGKGTGPLLVLGQSSLVFGTQLVNTSTTRQLTVINLGNTPFSQPPSATAPFSVPNTALTIAAGASKTLDVTFAPTSRGSFTGALTLANASTCPTPPVAWLTGEGLAPAKLVLSRDTLSFPETAVGTASAPQEVTLRNDGDTLLQVAALTLPQSSQFSVSPSGAFNLAPGEIQRLSLTFRPTQAGTATRTLTFTSNDTSAPSLSMSGTTTPGTACLEVSPRSFDFAEQQAGDAASEFRRVTVSNTGTVALTVTPALTGSTAFSVNPTTAFTLAPGAAGRELFITFDPDINANGAVQGVLTFGSSPSTTCPSDVALSGTARKTSLTVSPASLPFGDMLVSEAPPTRQVTLTNPTNWPVKVFQVPPESLTPYTLTGIPTSGLIIEPRSTALLTVTFAASTWGESFSRTLKFQTDASLPVASVAITGRALAPELTLDNDTLVFLNVAPGGERLSDVILRNTGNQALFLSRITPDSAAHFQVVDFLPQTVQPNGSTTVKVRFRPDNAVGDLETRLRFFTSNDRQLPPTLVVKGNSNGPIAIFGANTIDFGDRQVDQVHVNDILTLRNGPSASEALKVLSVRVLPFGSAFSVDPITSSEPELGRGSTRPQPFRVTFKPTVEGQQYEDALEIVYRGVTSGLTTIRTFPLLGGGADAKLSAPTDVIDFPATQPTTSSLRSIVITNSGLVPVDLSSVVADPPYSAVVEQWPDPIIPVGGSRRIDITFTPQAPGNYSSSLKISLKKSPGTVFLTRTLSGVAAVAQLEMDKNQLVFSEVPRLTTSTQSVTLRNSGSAPLTIYNATGSGPFSAKLQTGQFPISLARGATTLLDVTFRPETALDASATLHVLSNSNQSEDQPIQASGRGTEPLLVLPGGPSPQFAPQALGSEGPAREVVVKNDGKAVLEVYAVSVPGDFCLRTVNQPQVECPTSLPRSVPNSNLAFTVAPGAVHSFFVSAKPTTRGIITNPLSIVSNARTTPDSVSLTVEGVGSVSLPSSTINFGSVNFGSYADEFVTVTNTGITVAYVTVNFDTGGSEFSALNLPLEVPAGGSAQLSLRFRPQGSTGGPRSAAARLNVQGAPQVPVTLEGTATSARLDLSRRDGKTFDGSLDFGGTRVNTASEFIGLRLTHSASGGTATASTDGGIVPDEGILTVLGITLEGEDAKSFVLQEPILPAKLVKGGSVDVTLQFRPDMQRRFNAVLRITSDDSLSSTTLVTLGGRGRTNQLSLSTPTLEFGARVAESSASALRSVRMTNDSLQPLQVQGLEIIGVAENSEPSHFSVESAPTLPFTLGAQESRDLFIKFVPRPDVTSRAALTVVTSDLESPVAQVSLSGRGLSTVFRSLSRTLDFGTVRQAEALTTKVQLTNDSTQELLLVQPKVEGPQATQFVVVSPVVGAEGRVLAQGDSLTLELKYDTSQIGAAKATLVLGTKDQERAALVALSGVTVASFLTIEPMELDLGWVDINASSEPRTVTLTNQSASPARLSVVENTNPAFEIDASALDAELAPGAQTTVKVTFRGQVGGPAEGTLKLRLRGETTAEALLTLKGQARTLGGTGGGCACGTSGNGGAALALLLLLGLGLSRRARWTQVED